MFIRNGPYSNSPREHGMCMDTNTHKRQRPHTCIHTYIHTYLRDSDFCYFFHEIRQQLLTHVLGTRQIKGYVSSANLFGSTAFSVECVVVNVDSPVAPKRLIEALQQIVATMSCSKVLQQGDATMCCIKTSQQCVAPMRCIKTLHQGIAPTRYCEKNTHTHTYTHSHLLFIAFLSAPASRSTCAISSLPLMRAA
jgi:hypothetical protein